MVLIIIRELVKYYGRIEQYKERNIYGCMVLCAQLLLQSITDCISILLTLEISINLSQTNDLSVCIFFLSNVVL